MIFGCVSAFQLFQQLKIQSVLTMSDAALAAQAQNPLPQNMPVAYYQAVSDRAMQGRKVQGLEGQRAEYELAYRATHKIIVLEPQNYAAWNRLAYLDVIKNGYLSRDGLIALYHSYEASPYGDLPQMIWRIDFAQSMWTSLPDDLQAKTLAQFKAIEGFGNSWDARLRLCRYGDVAAIQDAACAIAPGVNPQNRPDQQLRHVRSPDLK